MTEHFQLLRCDGCHKKRWCHHDAAGGWYCPLCYQPIPPDARIKAAAWDALVAILPTLGEWERGRVLAEEGRLIGWVMRNAPHPCSCPGDYTDGYGEGGRHNQWCDSVKPNIPQQQPSSGYDLRHMQDAVRAKLGK